MDPSDMSGGTGGRYPEWTKQQLMLLLLWNKLREAYVRGGSELMLMVARGSGGAGLHMLTGERTNLADEIPELIGPGEAIAIFDRLRREGYIHVDYGRENPSAEVAVAVLHGLSIKGLLDIGKFPDPDERLAEAFMSARRLLEQDSSIPQDDKKDVLDTMSKTASLLNNVRGLGTAVMQYLGPHGGVVG